MLKISTNGMMTAKKLIDWEVNFMIIIETEQNIQNVPISFPRLEALILALCSFDKVLYPAISINHLPLKN